LSTMLKKILADSASKESFKRAPKDFGLLKKTQKSKLDTPTGEKGRRVSSSEKKVGDDPFGKERRDHA